MFSTILFKRGKKVNLPILDSGEFAFTSDSNELFIGDGSSNYNLTTSRRNYFMNSNLQAILESTDYTDNSDHTILASSGRYIFGNYYLSNGSTGTVDYYMPTSTNKLMQLVSSSATPSLSYQSKVPSTNYSALANKIVCLSFDIQCSSNLTFSCGIPGNLISQTINAGTQRVSASFTASLTTLAGKNFTSLNIVIFKVSTPISMTISIGNFKLELGSTPTVYTPNALYQDVILLKNSVSYHRSILRCSAYTANTFSFFFDPLIYIYNSPPILTLESIHLYNLTVPDPIIEIQGFTSTISYTSNNYVSIVSTKANHGLTDISADIRVKIDNRP